MTEKRVDLSANERKLLSKLTVEELQQLTSLKESGKQFTALHSVIKYLIDLEKNYVFGLNEGTMTPYQLGVSHAYSRGQVAFGTILLRLIQVSSNELAKREQIQKDIRKKQEQE